jgi:hypothetical protein
MIYSGLLDVFQLTKHDMCGCSTLASLQSDLLCLLCLSHTSLPKCATDPYFSYICKSRCILPIGHDDHAHINEYFSVRSSLVHHNQSSATGAWYNPTLFSYLFEWFDLAHNKFDHRASVRTLD